VTFKTNWEKADKQIQLSLDTIRSMVKQAFPEKTLESHDIISGGCANLNIKIHLKTDEHPYILRVYLRDKEAAFREQKIGELLKQTVPIPAIYFIGDDEQHRFAITQFIEGITLRELLLGDLPHNLPALMYEAGSILGKIQSHHFKTAGFFDENLTICEPISQSGLVEFAKNCLKNATAMPCLSNTVLMKIDYFLEKYQSLFPDEHNHHLVHADYDPANILVNQRNGDWEITGVLDWEFSFSGSPLWDVANMLRYAHQMPTVFETSFLKGLSSSFSLPEHWKLSVHLLNLLSLLDCLVRCPPLDRPNQCKDICTLIQYITDQLDKTP